MEKKLYYRFSDGGDAQNITMDLSAAKQWIESDMENYKDGDEVPIYTLSAVWLIEDEFDNLPEADL